MTEARVKYNDAQFTLKTYSSTKHTLHTTWIYLNIIKMSRKSQKLTPPREIYSEKMFKDRQSKLSNLLINSFYLLNYLFIYLFIIIS